MGLFNNNLEDALYEARIAPNFVKYEEKKNARIQEVANQLRKDLNFSLAPNNREFLLSVFPSFDIKSRELFYDYHSPDIFTPHQGDKTLCGFNPVDPDLAKLVDKLDLRDNAGFHNYNRYFLFDNIGWKTYYYDTARNVDEGGEIYHKPGFIACSASSSRLNKLIDGELWNFYQALKNGNEKKIKGSLENICAVLELNSSLQNLWTEYIGNKVINEHIDEFKKDVFKNCSMASPFGNPIDLDKNLTREVKEMRSEYRATRKELESLIENKVYDAFKKHDKKAFKKAFDKLEYAPYIEKLEEFSRRSKEYDKKFDVLYKERSRKEREAESKKKNVYQKIAEKYTVQNNDRLLETLISNEDRNRLEKTIVNMVEKNPQSFSNIANHCVTGKEQEKMLNLLLKSMLENKKIRYDNNSKKFIPMKREIVFDETDINKTAKLEK